MAKDIDKVLIGAGSIFEIGAYVTAKGAGTLAELGHLLEGVRFKATVEHKLIEPDAHLAAGRAVPIKREYTVQVKGIEATPELLRIALGQPAANLTGTPPNMTLNVDPDAVEQYHQLRWVEPGLGTTKVRTVTAWKAYLKEVPEIVASKGDIKEVNFTFGLLYEETGTGTDDVVRLVET